MKRTKRFIRLMAAGAVLAFTFSMGISAQAKTEENLTEVTEISESEFDMLKPEGEVTLEQKHQVIGEILIEAGVPEFMVEKLNDDMFESLYDSPGFEVQTKYFREKVDGDLEQISYGQHKRIAEYNRLNREKNKMMPYSPIALRAQEKIESDEVFDEIPNLAHVLIVGMPQSNQRRFCAALAGWEYAPITRADDFIGIHSDKAQVINHTAVASISYVKNLHVVGTVLDGFGEEVQYEDDKFIDNTSGVGKEFQLPGDYYDPNTNLGSKGSYRIEELALGLTVDVIPVDPTTVQNFSVLSTYYHEALEIGGNVEISSSGIGFTASPSLVFRRSDVSVFIQHEP